MHKIDPGCTARPLLLSIVHLHAGKEVSMVLFTLHNFGVNGDVILQVLYFDIVMHAPMSLIYDTLLLVPTGLNDKNIEI